MPDRYLFTWNFEKHYGEFSTSHFWPCLIAQRIAQRETSLNCSCTINPSIRDIGKPLSKAEDEDEEEAREILKTQLGAEVGLSSLGMVDTTSPTCRRSANARPSININFLRARPLKLWLAVAFYGFQYREFLLCFMHQLVGHSLLFLHCALSHDYSSQSRGLAGFSWRKRSQVSSCVLTTSADAIC